MIIKPARIKNFNSYALATIMPSLIPLINSSLYTIASTIISAGLILNAEYKRARIKYIINNEEIIHEVGLVNKTRNITKVGRIAQFRIKQNLLEKLLNYGHIDLETWGTPLKLENIRNPGLIIERIKELQKDSEY